MQRASSIASSSASLVPEPIEKCAVCAASPISTSRREAGRGSSQCTQRSQTTRGKRIHCVEPRRWLTFEISGWPSRYSTKSFSQKAIASSFSIVSRPAARQTLLGRLDDEGRGVVVEAVGVRLEPAVLGLLEGEGERLEQLRRAEPDEAAVAQVDVGLVGGGVLAADAAVEAVAGDDEVGVGVRSSADLHVGLETQLDAERLAARLQDVEQALPADAAEAVAARDGSSRRGC